MKCSSGGAEPISCNQVSQVYNNEYDKRSTHR